MSLGGGKMSDTLQVTRLPTSSWEAVLARLRGIGYQTSGNVAMVTMRVLTRNGAPVL